MNALDPVLPGFYPDPSICRAGDDYYLVTSTFHYFPGVPLFHSRDLVHWRQIGHCLTRPEQLPLADAKTSGGIYAPTLRHHHGVFYMVTTNVSQQRHFVVSTRDPAGQWSDPVWIDSPIMAANGSRGIDPSLFFDSDGEVFLTWTDGVAGGNHIYQAPIDLVTGTLLAAPREIWKGTGGQHTEAPHLYRIGRWYVLLLAEGGTSYGHMVTMARSETPWGPWDPCPHNPIFTHRSLDIPVQATGHGDLVETPAGEWWMVYLAVRPDMGHPRAYHLGRETFIAPVVWEDGWPRVAENGRLSVTTRVPALAGLRVTDASWEDAFTGLVWRPEWTFLRNPDAASYRIEDRGLRLFGTKTTLDDAGSPTWIGRRQQHFTCEFSVVLTLDACTRGRSGLTAYMDEAHHYDVTLARGRTGAWLIQVRLRIGPIYQVLASCRVETPTVRLAIRADAREYHLGWMSPDFQPLASARVRYLSTEVAQGFTGVFFAVFAEGEGTACTVQSCRYRPDHPMQKAEESGK